jgi:hypothetical protein
MHTGFGGNLREKERYYFEDLNLDVRTILKWIFKNWDGKAWTGLS